jgi:hypothetical protein
MNRTDRQKYSREVRRINKRFETHYYEKVKNAVQGEVSSLISYMSEHGVSTEYFNRIHSNGELSRVIQSMYKTVGIYHANRVTRMLRMEKRSSPLARVVRLPKSLADDEGQRVVRTSAALMTKGFGFNATWVDFILNYFQKHLVQYITFGSVETMRKYFFPIISKAVSEGTPFAEVVRQIEEINLPKWQAARIVRTEVNGASNLGVRAAGSTYEYQTQKEWISAHDARVRGRDAEDKSDHIHLDGQVVDFNQAFTDPKNGVRLMQPGDPEARGDKRSVASTVINCRCTHALIPKRDSEGRLIPK